MKPLMSEVPSKEQKTIILVITLLTLDHNRGLMEFPTTTWSVIEANFCGPFPMESPAQALSK